MKIHKLALAMGVLGASIATFAVASENIIRTQAPIRFVSQQPNPPVTVPEETAATFSITSGALPQGEEGVAYSFNLNTRVVWDKPEFSRSLIWTTSTTLPAGLTLSADGVLSGVPEKGFNGTLSLMASSGDTSLSSGFGLYVYSDIGDKPAFTGVVTLYRFNGNATNNGSYTLPLSTVGNISYTADSPIPGESALVLNGASGFRNGSSYPFGTSDFSTGAWIKYSGTGQQTITQHRDYENNGQYVFYVTGGLLVYYEYPSGIGLTGISTSISSNEWHHVGVVRSGNVVSLYLDGQKVKSVTATTNNTMRSDNGFAIGYDQRDNNKYFSGNLKDVFEFNRALTEREMKWLYKSGEGFPQP